MQPFHLAHFTSEVSFSRPGLAGRFSPRRMLSKCQLYGLSMSCGAWDMAAQPIRFAISQKTGMLEWWSIGVMGFKPRTPSFHYSIIPIFLCSRRFHIGELRHRQIQLEAAAAAVR